MKTSTLPRTTELPSIIGEVRKWKEQHAAEYDFDIRAIGRALQEAEKRHPDRIVNREESKKPKSEQTTPRKPSD